MRGAALWALKPFSISCKYIAAYRRTVIVRGVSRTAIPHVPRKRISQEDLETIVRLRREGQTHPDIATILGNRTRNSVSSAFSNYCKKTGSGELKKRTSLTAAQHEEITKMRCAGKQWREIAVLFGMQHQTLRSAHLRHVRDPAPRPRRAWTDDDSEYLLHAKNNLKLSWDVIAHQLDRSTQSVTSRYYSERLLGKPHRVWSPRKYSEKELDRLIHLREERQLEWQEISSKMPGRSLEGLKNRYTELKDDRGDSLQPVTFFTLEEDQKLEELRTIRKLPWMAVKEAMPSRSLRSLTRRYYLLRERSGEPVGDHVDPVTGRS